METELNSVGTEMVPVVETGEIVPAENGEIHEVTPGQAALVLGSTMLVGYGLGKLGEFVLDKWLTPGWNRVNEKLQARKRKKELEKMKDQVETTVVKPDESGSSEEEQKDKYEKATERIRANNYKKS